MSRRLLVVLLAVIASVVGLVVWDPYDKILPNRLLGGVLILVGVTPICRWILVEGNRLRFPAFELLSLFYAGSFGVAGFISHERMQGRLFVDEKDYSIALISALTSWVLIAIGYRVFSFKTLRFSTDLGATPKLADQLIVCVYPVICVGQLVVNYLALDSLTQIITATRMFFVFWIMYIVINPGKSTGMFISLCITFIVFDLIVFGGFLEGRLLSIVTYGVAYVFGRILIHKKVPIAFLAIVVVAFIVLQPAKAAFRYMTWSEGKTAIGLDSITSLATLGDSIIDQFSADDGVVVAGLVFNEAYLRVNHLHTLAAVIRDTPSEVPFAEGSTLTPLLTKFIPRAIWSDKPLEDVGNRWAHEYQYLSSDDFVTSYNLPWVPEMYMNFGWIGITVLSLFIGVLLGFINRVVFSNVVGPARFSIAVSLGVVFVMPESNLSGMIGGFMINWLILIFIASFVLFLSRQKRRKFLD